MKLHKTTRGPHSNNSYINEKIFFPSIIIELVKQFNKIAKKRKISRNNLCNIIKQNIIFKNLNKSQLRLYKYIFRGEIIPSPKFVHNSFKEHDDLPSYLALVYLD